MKDELERQLSIMVCAGDATLTGAQHEIGTDWRTAYKKWIDGKGCGENPDKSGGGYRWGVCQPPTELGQAPRLALSCRSTACQSRL